MSGIFNWIKNNKLTFVLFLVILFLVGQKYLKNPPVMPFAGPQTDTMMSVEPRMMGKAAIGGADLGYAPPYGQTAPVPEVQNRLVQQESYLSLQVKDVREAQNQIIAAAKSMGGYMVNTFLENPQDTPTSNITIRIPAERLDQALSQFRGLAVKVVSENLSGQDVTDQFVDNEARLATLEETKAKFREIFDQAVKIEDILNIQQQLISIQSQIDALKGQQNYLEKTSQLARLTIYLSTDEFALPYAPSESWRPEVIFKQAVRSLVGQFRKLGTAVIWLAVYSLVLIPVLLVIRYFARKK